MVAALYRAGLSGGARRGATGGGSRRRLLLHWKDVGLGLADHSSFQIGSLLHCRRAAATFDVHGGWLVDDCLSVSVIGLKVGVALLHHRCDAENVVTALAKEGIRDLEMRGFKI